MAIRVLRYKDHVYPGTLSGICTKLGGDTLSIGRLYNGRREKIRPQPVCGHVNAGVREEDAIHNFVGTNERTSECRGACLVRDRHRCATSRSFYQNEAADRYNTDG